MQVTLENAAIIDAGWKAGTNGKLLAKITLDLGQIEMRELEKIGECAKIRAVTLAFPLIDEVPEGLTLTGALEKVGFGRATERRPLVIQAVTKTGAIEPEELADLARYSELGTVAVTIQTIQMEMGDEPVAFDMDEPDDEGEEVTMVFRGRAVPVGANGRNGRNGKA